MFARGCVKVFGSISICFFIYCFLVMLTVNSAYCQDAQMKAAKPASGDIQGRLKDAQTGEWINGATITINTSPPQTATMGKYGAFAFYGVDVPMYGEKEYTLTIQAKDGDPYLTTEVPVTVKCSDTVAVTIELEPVPLIGNIEGTVKSSPAGVGIIGLGVILLKDGTQVGLSVTDNDGKYYFDDLEPGEYAVATGTEYEFFEHGYTDGVEVVGLKTTIVDFNLRRLMRGSVIDKDTLSNITGATVRIIDQEAESTTDAEGKFELLVEYSGFQWVLVTGDGYNLAVLNINFSDENLPPLDVSLFPIEDPNLPAPGSIAGAVMTPGNLGGAASVIISVFQGSDIVGTKITDRSGQYKFESLQPGTYRVVAFSLIGEQIGERDGIVVESNGLRIVGFTGMPTFQGLIVDSGTGDPLSGATVMEMPSGLTSTTEPDGSSYFDFDTFGHHDFVVSHDGHYTDSFPVTITVENVNDPPTFSLDPVPPGQQTPGTIMGIVTSNMQNVNVKYVTVKLFQGSNVIEETNPQESGLYIFPAVDAGTYSVSAIPPPACTFPTMIVEVNSASMISSMLS